MRQQIDGHDGLGPEQPRHRRTQQPNGARAKHDDTPGLRGPHVDHADRMCRDGQRLREHALLQRHTGRQLIAQVGGDLEVLGQRAVGVGRTGGELHRRTQIVQPFLAAAAGPARHAGLDRHVVAGLQVRHRRPDGVDRPRRFVPHDHRLPLAHVLVVDPAVRPEVDLF